MTESEARKFGARWLAAVGPKGWTPGMAVLVVPDEDDTSLTSGIATAPPSPSFVVAVDDDGVTVAWSEYPGTADGGLALRDDVPALRDAGTRGLCLDLLRAAWGLAAQVSPWTSTASLAVSGWRFCANDADDWTSATAASEAESLVLAAEAWAAKRGRAVLGG